MYWFLSFDVLKCVLSTVFLTVIKNSFVLFSNMLKNVKCLDIFSISAKLAKRSPENVFTNNFWQSVVCLCVPTCSECLGHHQFTHEEFYVFLPKWVFISNLYLSNVFCWLLNSAHKLSFLLTEEMICNMSHQSQL